MKYDICKGVCTCVKKKQTVERCFLHGVFTLFTVISLTRTALSNYQTFL